MTDLTYNKWIDRGRGVLSMYYRLDCVDASERPFKCPVDFRIDSRGNRVRVDVSSWVGTWTLWEAIDDGYGFETVSEAKRFIRRYIAEKKQRAKEAAEYTARYSRRR